MLDQVVIVAITAPDRPSGYRIFESMNDRGARLTPVDLLRSYLMSKVGGAEDEATPTLRKYPQQSLTHTITWRCGPAR